ncbi:MAG TPA: condensation domain-containing protein [Terriglobales bacterium]|jgi:hypothetical protein
MDSPATTGFQLSLQQKRVWKLQRAQQFVSQIAILLQGELDQQRLHSALIKIFQRHQILRTFFQRSPGVEFPIQMVEENAAFSCFRSSLGEMKPGSEEDQVQSALRTQSEADLLDGSALDVALIDGAPDRHFVLFTLPAVCADFVTLKNLVVELQEHYAGVVTITNQSQQYGDYTKWQSQLLQNNDAQSLDKLSFWKLQDTSSMTPLELSCQKTGGENAAFATAAIPIRLPYSVLHRISPSTETLADWLLSAWQVLLWQLGGRPDFAIGFVSDGRGCEKFMNAMGLYAKTLPLRISMAPNRTFAECVRATGKMRASAIEHQDYYERTDDSLPIGFVMEEEVSPQTVRGLRISVYALRCEIERFHLALKCLHSPDACVVELIYDPAYFEQDTVERISQQLSRILAAGSSDPNSTMASLLSLNVEPEESAEPFDPTAVHRPYGSSIDDQADE